MKRSMKRNMKKDGKKKTVLALVLALLMVVGIIPMDFMQMRVKAAYTFQVYDVVEGVSLTEYKVQDGKPYSSGRVFVPKADGQYPVIIYLHGAGGPLTTLTILPELMDYWTSVGYVDPAVVVLPKIEQIQEKDFGTKDFGLFVSDGYCEKLVNFLNDDSDVKNNPWKKKIDTTKIDTIMGYSMGGSAALYAGITLPKVFKNVCAVSPSQLFYMNGGDPNWYWVTDNNELNFSNEQGAHMMLAYGLGEDEQYIGPSPIGAANRYFKASNKRESNKNKFLMYEVAEYIDGNKMGHDHNLFYRETFCYLYYLKFNELPSDELITKAMKRKLTPLSKTLTGTVDLKGNAIFLNQLGAYPSGYNCSEKNLSYQWQRDGVNIGGATSASYYLGADDIGHKVRCIVKDKTATYTGSIISAETGVVKKAYGPAAPTGLTATPCTKGKQNGTIKNVTTKMEYSTSYTFDSATPCTGTEITNLAPGTYFIRVAETKTVNHGAYCYITVKEQK